MFKSRILHLQLPRKNETSGCKKPPYRYCFPTPRHGDFSFLYNNFSFFFFCPSGSSSHRKSFV